MRHSITIRFGIHFSLFIGMVFLAVSSQVSAEASNDIPVLDQLIWRGELAEADSWHHPSQAIQEDPLALHAKTIDQTLTRFFTGADDLVISQAQKHLRDEMQTHLQLFPFPKPSGSHSSFPSVPVLIYEGQNKDIILHGGWNIQVDACYFRMSNGLK